MRLFDAIFRRNKVDLQLHDIQAIILRNRPVPYFGTNALFYFENSEEGKELLRTILPFVRSVKDWQEASVANITLAITYSGLQALGVPDSSLDSFPEAFRQGMAARAGRLHDKEENSPVNWQEPFRSGKFHLALSIIADDEQKWKAAMMTLESILEKFHRIELVLKHDFSAPDSPVNVFGFRDGISNPEIEGSGAESLPGYGKPIKAGEFILGYPGESGAISNFPQPGELGKNGSFLVLRKYHSKVALFNQFLKKNAKTKDEQELLGAKIFGRWRSGAPLTLAPYHDNPEIGADSSMNNSFSYKDDQGGKIVPLSCHMRRMNPRDTKQFVISDVNLHRIIRKSVSYGTPLGSDIVKDDGEERGQYFIGISAKAMETVEFLQSQWIDDGNFINHGEEKDPVTGLNQGKGYFTVPSKPFMKRYTGIETFNVMQGGEYFFLPSLTAIKWLSDLS